MIIQFYSLAMASAESGSSFTKFLTLTHFFTQMGFESATELLMLT